MKGLRGSFLALLIIAIVSGCAAWQLIGNDNTKWKSRYFEAQLPKGWVKYNHPQQLLSLTKDGFFLQQITITRIKTDKELPLTKKKIKDNPLLQETANLIADEMALSKELYNFKVSENKPVTIDRTDGFKLVYSFNNEDFLKYEGIIYGFILDKNYYEIEYIAAKQHYFEKCLPDFEGFINSFKINKK